MLPRCRISTAYCCCAFVIILVFGCDEEQSTVGQEGEPCYPNNTCEAGLVCYSGICVKPNKNDARTIFDSATDLDAVTSKDRDANDLDEPDWNKHDTIPDGLSFCTNKPKGAICNDGNPCTKSDVCDGKGSCAGTIYTCSPGQCESSSTCDGKGGCLATYKVSGTSCNDGNACTKSDVCNGKGGCAGTSYTCSPGQCEATSTCDGKGGCLATYKGSGTSCNDGNACTKSDVCNGKGGCAGTAYTCSPGQCEATSTCDGKGGCLATYKVSGTSCNDGNACTKSDVCDGKGSCGGMSYTCSTGQCDASSTCDGKGGCKKTFYSSLVACNDSVACTKNDHCDGKGGCGGTLYSCTPSQCQTTATCDGKGGCIASSKAKGTACDDGNLCTWNDACDGAGSCAGKVYTCTPKWCQANPVCDGKGGCTYTLKAGYCLIGGSCYQAGFINPANACQKCDTASSTTAWTSFLGQGCVMTLAGSGGRGFADGPVASAKFNLPYDLALDGTGKIYVADTWNHRIRVISGGKVTTLAGTGVSGFADGPVASAKFAAPAGVAIDQSGKIYVADSNNNRIRIINGGQVTTFAGTGSSGHANGPRLSATFDDPMDVTVDGSGKVYVVDMWNDCIRQIYGGNVSTFAGECDWGGYLDGPALSALFSLPAAIALDNSGNVYVTDRANHRIRMIAKGTVSTFAGNGVRGYSNGSAMSSKFDYLWGIAIHSSGKVYIGDQYNERIRLVSGGQVTTVAGQSTSGFADGPVTTAKFSWPRGVAVDWTGKVYVADTWNDRIRVIRP